MQRSGVRAPRRPPNSPVVGQRRALQPASQAGFSPRLAGSGVDCATCPSGCSRASLERNAHPLHQPTPFRHHEMPATAPMNPAPALILFDIDGTLIRRAGPHHRQALVDAVRRVTGLETSTDGIPVHGMLDPHILTQMMKARGLDEAAIQSAMPRTIEAAQNFYEESVPDLRDRRCPGVEALL